MNRIERKFIEFNKKRKSALITYIMGGDPDYKTSLSILKKLPKAGADIIELGIPFSDPMADGPTIQEAAIRSLKSGTTLRKIINIAKEFRKSDKETPLILMGYYNPILAYGTERFVKDIDSAGVDGVLLVDLPPEEDSEFRNELDKTEISMIRLVTPTSSQERIKKIATGASGFIYYVSIAGITGTKSATINSIKKSLDGIRKETDLPIAVGFGIKTSVQVKEIAGIAEGVVVGSALVSNIKNNLSKNGKANTKTIVSPANFVKNLARGIKK